MNTSQLPESLPLLALVLAAFALPACAGVPIRDYVADAADQQAVVCGLADNTPPGNAAVDRVRDLCAKGASLREIAAAYAGCEAGEAGEADAK